MDNIGLVRGCLSVTACKGNFAFAPDGPSWAQNAMTTSLAQNLKPILMLKHDKSVINVPQISLIVKLGAELQGYPFHVRPVVPPFLLVVFSFPLLTLQNLHIPSIQSQSDLLSPSSSSACRSLWQVSIRFRVADLRSRQMAMDS